MNCSNSENWRQFINGDKLELAKNLWMENLVVGNFSKIPPMA